MGKVPVITHAVRREQKPICGQCRRRMDRVKGSIWVHHDDSSPRCQAGSAEMVRALTQIPWAINPGGWLT